jgi:hypothetical protein
MDWSGTFAYQCLIHGSSMQGKIRVPIGVSATTVVVGNTIDISVATDTVTPSGTEAEIRRRKVGGTWRTISQSSIAQITKAFNKEGTFQLKSRLIDTASGQKSGWSPVQPIVVTAG